MSAPSCRAGIEVGAATGLSGSVHVGRTPVWIRELDVMEEIGHWPIAALA